MYIFNYLNKCNYLFLCRRKEKNLQFRQENVRKSDAIKQISTLMKNFLTAKLQTTHPSCFSGGCRNRQSFLEFCSRRRTHIRDCTFIKMRISKPPATLYADCIPYPFLGACVFSHFYRILWVRFFRYLHKKTAAFAIKQHI